MGELHVRFQERLNEVEAYFDFLAALDRAAQSGPPKLNNAEDVINPNQIRILLSSAYLQLYNLVEATMSDCIDSVTNASRENNQWKPGDLARQLRKEWVRFIARTHEDLASENRLAKAMDLCNHLVESLPVDDFSIEKGSAGNWDDVSIERFIKNRLGFDNPIDPAISTSVKNERFRDGTGALVLIKRLRNRLAHGNISFVQCSENDTVSELTELKDLTKGYLIEVVRLFSEYLENFYFLDESRRSTNP